MNFHLKKIKEKFYTCLLKIPGINIYSATIYRALGVHGKDFKVSPYITIVGEFSNIILSENAEINRGCFLLAKDRIIIGKNSTLAYQSSILTSANPNGPKNLLYRIFGNVKKPVKIGDNCWIGARAVLLPGITIGNFCVVGAGSVVTKDVPDYSVVAGAPAILIKKLDKDKLN